KINAGIILGSGLGSFAAEVRQPVVVPYEDISTMPQTSVAGHEGKLIFGMINDKKVLAFSGRFHHYEGFSFEQTATPVYLSKALGARKLIISNAAGGINTSFNVGDLMVIEDIIRGNGLISPTGVCRHAHHHYQWVYMVLSLSVSIGLTIRQVTYMYFNCYNY